MSVKGEGASRLLRVGHNRTETRLLQHAGGGLEGLENTQGEQGAQFEEHVA